MFVSELTSLYLGGNQIAEVPSGIKSLQKLKFLYLGGNLIKKLPKEICHLERLQAFFICFNQVHYRTYHVLLFY
jgi:Leucine-rich repeat (LRR) protein